VDRAGGLLGEELAGPRLVRVEPEAVEVQSG
jgi:hypothetical protein